MRIRTDLAVEAAAVASESGKKLNGIIVRDEKLNGLRISRVKITTDEGSAMLEKPCGTYVTIYLDGLARHEPEIFERSVHTVASLLRELLHGEAGSVLVAGLGNRFITPDAIGPRIVENTIVTRHLTQQQPDYFAEFRPVSAISPGVLGNTGIETGEIIRGIAERVHPDVIIAADALASGSMERLCTTIQLSDTGIIPGSGVGNRRNAINQASLGVPVIALGVPTVVDAATIAADITGRRVDTKKYSGMIVTPKDIDAHLSDIAKVAGYAINFALHDTLSMSDVELFLS